jgi:phage N-6-adenine-methyltransferase
MDVHFSSNTAEWPTPDDLLAQILKVYPLALDVCATDANHKCARYFTKADDGLAQEWRGVCWMNPPYGNPEHACKKNCKKKKCKKRGHHNDTYVPGIRDWVAKAAQSADTLGSVVVTLLPSRTDTLWWHEFCEPILRGKKPGEVVFLKGRLTFGDATMPAPFPSVIVVFGSLPASTGAA